MTKFVWRNVHGPTFEAVWCQNPEEQKAKQFAEFDRKYGGDEEDDEFVNQMKAGWLTSRGNHYGGLGQYDQAEIDCLEAIEIKSDNAPAYTTLSIVYRETERLDEALAILDKAPRKAYLFGEEMRDSSFEILTQKVSVYLLLEDRPRVLKTAQEALVAARDPKRKEQLESAERVAVEAEVAGIEMLEGLIQELESV